MYCQNWNDVIFLLKWAIILRCLKKIFKNFLKISEKALFTEVIFAWNKLFEMRLGLK